MIEIQDRYTGVVIDSASTESMKAAVVQLVKRGADLTGAKLGGARLNWQSHALLSHVLGVAAGESEGRRMVAGLIAISTDWCWDRLLLIEHPEKAWALRTLAASIVDGDGHPDVLDAYRHAEMGGAA